MDIRNTQRFQIKKWLLFGGCALCIISSIIFAAVATSLATRLADSLDLSDFPDRDNASLREARNAFKTVILSVIWVLCGLSILFDLVGLMGAYKENYCMTVTYAILRTIVSLVFIYPAVEIGAFWAQTVFSLILCSIAYVFAHELHKRRNILFRPSQVVIGGSHCPAPPFHTSNIMHVTPTYAPGVNYGTQQTPQQQNGWYPPPAPPTADERSDSKIGNF